MEHRNPRIASFLGLRPYDIPSILSAVIAVGLLLPRNLCAEDVYFTDFEGTVGSEWSISSTDITPSGRRFLGEFQNQNTTLTLANLPQHNALTVSFDLFVIRSWDGNRSGDGHGPDEWDVSVVGEATLQHTTFSCTAEPGHPSNRQAFPGEYPGASYLGRTGASEINTLGYPLANNGDSVYSLSYTFHHTAPGVQIRFSDSVHAPTGSNDETWGIDNVRLEIFDSTSIAFNPNNGHYYEFASLTGTWGDARTEAESRTYLGASGHLATITTAFENSFITSNFLIGNPDPFSYYTFIGGIQPPGASEPSGGWQWTTGESWSYENWEANEPNNNGGIEDWLNIWDDKSGHPLGTWNDLDFGPSNFGFIIEYDTDALIITTPGYSLWDNVDEYDAVYVINGGSIVVPPATWDGSTWIRGYLMLEAETIYVGPSSSIHADGAGFGLGDAYTPDPGGPGRGSDGGDLNGLINAGGAGFGGGGGTCQTTAQPGGPYGPADQDDTYVGTLFGSAGGDFFHYEGIPPILVETAVGGRGGGYIRLRGNTVTIEGTVSANGGAGMTAVGLPGAPGAGSGGGSGGQIVIDGDVVEITGTVGASGGQGSDPSEYYSAGGGAGGRIKIFAATDYICGGTIYAPGGSGACSGQGSGKAGTVHQPGIATVPPMIVGLANDTGRSASDLVTYDPTISGTAEPGSTINLYVGGSVVGSGQASGGQFQIPMGSLPEGAVSVTATAQAPCLTESAFSGPFAFTLDTVAPVVPSAPDLTPTSDTGRYDDDDITRDWGPLFQGTSESDMDIKLYEGAAELGTNYTGNGDWQVLSGSLTEGAHQISATALDAAGNESSASGVISILVDNTDPMISNPSVTPTNCPHARAIFNLQVTVTDALSGVQNAATPEVTLRLDANEADVFDLAPLGGSLFGRSWDSTGQQPGVYSVDVAVWDLAGNKAELLDAATICIAVPADLDEDGDVDLDDYGVFADCMGGPGVAYPGGCEHADLDANSHVDLQDFSQWQRAFH